MDVASGSYLWHKLLSFPTTVPFLTCRLLFSPLFIFFSLLRLFIASIICLHNLQVTRAETEIMVTHIYVCVELPLLCVRSTVIITMKIAPDPVQLQTLNINERTAYTNVPMCFKLRKPYFLYICNRWFFSSFFFSFFVCILFGTHTLPHSHRFYLFYFIFGFIGVDCVRI